jgi:hypothetical protein
MSSNCNGLRAEAAGVPVGAWFCCAMETTDKKKTARSASEKNLRIIASPTTPLQRSTRPASLNEAKYDFYVLGMSAAHRVREVSSVLLFFCSSVLLFFCSSVLLFFCSSVLLFFCSSVLLFFCSY